ncbi:hypothetical protein Q5752_005926 [Cryptotrichosporon argae]
MSMADLAHPPVPPPKDAPPAHRADPVLRTPRSRLRLLRSRPPAPIALDVAARGHPGRPVLPMSAPHDARGVYAVAPVSDADADAAPSGRPIANPHGLALREDRTDVGADLARPDSGDVDADADADTPVPPPERSVLGLLRALNARRTYARTWESRSAPASPLPGRDDNGRPNSLYLSPAMPAFDLPRA